MSRYFSYLNSAKEILSLYDGDEPFASFLKKYFSRYKKFGSKDRRQVSHLCYCYFRLGKAVVGRDIEERILIALFLCTGDSNEILQQLKPSWNKNITRSYEEKYSLLENEGYHMEAMSKIFPWHEKLSDGISPGAFSKSFLIQPNLFVRIRPGNEEAVKQKLHDANMEIIVDNDNAIGLANAVKIEGVVDLDREAVIQDISSQETGDLLVPLRKGNGITLKVWDCCAASGGKSIMATDIIGNIDLAVSDIRESILHNLKKRFARAGIHKYKSFVADLTKPGRQLPVSNIDLIIADAPCTGSGTWGRTPEQLFYFNETEIGRYAQLQRTIVINATKHLKAGGYLLYITCSVFRNENEEVINYVARNLPLSVKEMKVISGYDKRADTMFAAMLQKDL